METKIKHKEKEERSFDECVVCVAYMQNGAVWLKLLSDKANLRCVEDKRTDLNRKWKLFLFCIIAYWHVWRFDTES